MTCVTGCQTALFKSHITTICPTIKEYTQEEQTAILNDLSAIDSDSMIWVAMQDYLVLRDKVRVCNQSGSDLQ